jgi:multicomponent Na+:H+ antiporter subunit E
MLNKNSIFIIIFLTVVWIILTESFSLITIGIGLAVSIAAILFWIRSLPNRIDVEYSVIKLAYYPFYLLLQIYLSGFWAIKLVIFGAKTETVTITTKLRCKSLRVILANSVTIIPGSVTIGLDDDKLTVLWLRDKNAEPATEQEANQTLISGLEKILLRAQNKERETRT